MMRHPLPTQTKKTVLQFLLPHVYSPCDPRRYRRDTLWGVVHGRRQERKDVGTSYHCRTTANTDVPNGGSSFVSPLVPLPIGRLNVFIHGIDIGRDRTHHPQRQPQHWPQKRPHCKAPICVVFLAVRQRIKRQTICIVVQLTAPVDDLNIVLLEWQTPKSQTAC